MINVYKKLVYILCFFLVKLFYCQKVDEINFGSPIGIPIALSGNFGELRTNHFHTGLDIKTNGSQNYRIYAIDSGYVSRINISHWGYGKAIYVDHPNGYTSVYAHLNRFPEKIEKIIRKKQYDLNKQIIEYYLDSSQILVSKGEVIAYSGNSGSSSGPHLHFEIRETQSEHPVNPQKFNFKIIDSKPPIISNIKIYTFLDDVLFQKCNDYSLAVKKYKDEYQLKYDSIISVNGPIGMGVNTSDFYNNSSNPCGIYSLKLFVDGLLKYDLKLDELDFDINDQVNIHKDYQEYQASRNKVHKLYIHPSNELDLYDRKIGNGILNFKDTLTHKVKIKVGDFNNNYSELSFYLKQKPHFSCNNKDNKTTVESSTKFYSEDSSLIIMMDSNSLYSPPNLSISPNNNSFKIYNDLPSKNKFVLFLKLSNQQIINGDKTFMAKLKKNGNISNKGGDLTKDWLSIQTKKFGTYKLITDTLPPKINHLGTNKVKYFNQTLNFRVTDDLSGIEDYHVYINDKWVLSNYSHRTSILSVPLDKYAKLVNGNQSCRVVVIDERKNESELEFKFKYSDK